MFGFDVGKGRGRVDVDTKHDELSFVMDLSGVVRGFGARDSVSAVTSDVSPSKTRTDGILVLVRLVSGLFSGNQVLETGTKEVRLRFPVAFVARTNDRHGVFKDARLEFAVVRRGRTGRQVIGHTVMLHGEAVDVSHRVQRGGIRMELVPAGSTTTCVGRKDVGVIASPTAKRSSVSVIITGKIIMKRKEVIETHA